MEDFPENKAQPNTPEWWQAQWEINLWWHRHHGNLTLHSRDPQDPPKGFIRLGYYNKVPEHGPNYFYIDPAWIKRVEEVQDDGRGRYWMCWNLPKKRGDDSSAHIDEESYQRVRRYSKPKQLDLFGKESR